MWKPGNLVTIKGVVYRVKREPEPFTSCKHCAFGDKFGNKLSCSLPVRRGMYPLSKDCYLERVSPIIIMIR
jgi:hypothetical protein